MDVIVILSSDLRCFVGSLAQDVGRDEASVRLKSRMDVPKMLAEFAGTASKPGRYGVVGSLENRVSVAQTLRSSRPPETSLSAGC